MGGQEATKTLRAREGQSERETDERLVGISKICQIKQPIDEMFTRTRTYDYGNQLTTANWSTPRRYVSGVEQFKIEGDSMPFPFPFKPTATPLDIQPKVTVEFAGQLILHPGLTDTLDNRTCEIGVNRFSRPHKLQVLLIVKEPTRAPTVIPLLEGPLTEDFMIRRGPDPHVPPHPNARPGNFEVFAPTADPFVRSAAGNSLNDYRWSINLRNPALEHPNVTRARGAEPVVRLRTGTLYSPDLTPANLQPRLRRDGSDDILLLRVPPELAASIVLDDGEQVLLEWNDLGVPFNRVLPRPEDDQNTVYTVLIINEPAPGSAEHEELALYYRVLQDSGNPIPPHLQWRLTFASGIGTDRIPCLPIVLNP
jgi:hypothetical protein